MPVSRCKHAATLHGQHVYLLGGRNGNLALKDFWRYHIGRRAWARVWGGGRNDDFYPEKELTHAERDTEMYVMEEITILRDALGDSLPTELKYR